jgi:hypothetical protein
LQFLFSSTAQSLITQHLFEPGQLKVDTVLLLAQDDPPHDLRSDDNGATQHATEHAGGRLPEYWIVRRGYIRPRERRRSGRDRRGSRHRDRRRQRQRCQDRRASVRARILRAEAVPGLLECIERGNVALGDRQVREKPA